MSKAEENEKARMNDLEKRGSREERSSGAGPGDQETRRQGVRRKEGRGEEWGVRSEEEVSTPASPLTPHSSPLTPHPSLPESRSSELGTATITKPVLIYDGDCKFCCYWIDQWKYVTEGRIEYAPYQEVADQFPTISIESFETAVQLIQPNGEVFSGAEAVFRALSAAPGGKLPLWAYRKLPGFATIAEWGYRFVAQNRSIFSTLTRWFQKFAGEDSSYFLTRWLFLRALGVIYLIAFLSLWVQIHGLVGSNGILPVNEYLQRVRELVGPERYWYFPTLCWLNTSDGFLHVLCGGGTLLSVLLIFDVAPIFALIGLWVFYLSLSVVGQDFLSFQWDVLLLETGFLSIFFAPLQFLPRFSQESPPSSTVLWLLRWLLFRLMFSSGVVKLVSGDPVWRDLTALNFHYETQPLPTWIGWYVHQLPEWFQKISVAGMFAIELIVPFFIFAPRRWRQIGCSLFILFQLAIIATGNYCFFNLISMMLCIPLLDDTILRRFLWKSPFDPQARGREHYTVRHLYRSLLVGMIAAGVVMMSSLQLMRTFSQGRELPSFTNHIFRIAGSFRTVNSYGLFADMTTSRPEVVVEGSEDVDTWHEYSFKWKPGDLKRAPRWVMPHQPRLDWQMWFAALRGDCRNVPWFMHFAEGLLKGTPEILALLEHNPFPESPPRYVRAVLYDYRFTDIQTKRAEGTWWHRVPKGQFCPTLSLPE